MLDELGTDELGQPYGPVRQPIDEVVKLAEEDVADRECEEVRFSAAGGPVLAGSLVLPSADPVGSAVLLIGGSGPAERTNDGFFTPVCEELLKGGAAVLTYDKRGAGLSEGCWHTADVHDLAADAGAGLALLQRRTRVRADRLVVLGHSEGAWVALRLGVASRLRGRLVLNSCPSVAFLEAEVYALRAAGSSAEHASRAGDHLDRLARWATAGEEATAGRERSLPVAHEEWFLELQAAGFRLDDHSWAQLRAWGGYDPRDDLVALRTPALSLFGSEDPLVPVARSVEVNQETSATAGRVHVNQVIAGVGHRMSSSPAERVSSRFLDHVRAWCTFPD